MRGKVIFTLCVVQSLRSIHCLAQAQLRPCAFAFFRKQAISKRTPLVLVDAPSRPTNRQHPYSSHLYSPVCGENALTPVSAARG